jgi:hypothetical protein
LGCTAWVHVPKEKRVKLDSHSDKGVLVGYGGTNQYRVWVESRNDIVVSRDVIFDEKPTTATPTTEIDDGPVIHDMIVVQSPPRSRTVSPIPDTTEESESESELESESDDQDPAEPSTSTAPEASTRQSGRANRGSHSTRYGDIVWDKSKSKKKSVAKIARIEPEVEPQSFEEAVNHPTRAQQ